MIGSTRRCSVAVLRRRASVSSKGRTVEKCGRSRLTGTFRGSCRKDNTGRRIPGSETAPQLRYSSSSASSILGSRSRVVIVTFVYDFVTSALVILAGERWNTAGPGANRWPMVWVVVGCHSSCHSGCQLSSSCFNLHSRRHGDHCVDQTQFDE